MKPSLPLVWLPGLLCDDRLFADMNKALPNWVAPYCVSLPAYPSMGQLADYVLEQAPEKFILGGLSMGGILAFEVYRRAPHRVKGLILMDTNAADEKQPVTDKRNALVKRALNGEFDQITPDTLLPILIHPSRLQDAELTQQVEQMAINVGVEAFQAHAQALATRRDARPLLADIGIPTLVITGKQDRLCPMANHLLMAEHIPDVTLHVVPECGHLSSMEHPKRVASHVSDWLSVHYPH